MSQAYCIEKLTRAMDALTLGEGDIRSRLKAAYQCLSSLSEADFPDGLRDNWKWIDEQMNKHEPLISPGGMVIGDGVKNAVRKIKSSTGVKIA